LNVPGSVFPSFLDVLVPHVPPVSSFQLSTGDTFIRESVITWDENDARSTAGNLIVVFDQRAYRSDPNQTVYTHTLVNCTVIDDGIFTLPDTIRSQISLSAELTTIFFTRLGRTVVQKDSTLLLVYGSSTSNF